jgi:hypothetical protein
MQILYVDKMELYPAFGYWIPGLIKIRRDLPAKVIAFVLYHESYHEYDQTKNWIKRELKANWYATRKCPCGALQTLWLSFSWARLGYYAKRFKEGK